MVIFYFILGMFMETLSMMVATVPIIAPIMFKAGYDPVWFGIIIIILMELAMITPPVGINLYVVQGLRKRGRIDDVIIGASPFVITMLLMIVILSIWPQIALWLPRLSGEPNRPRCCRAATSAAEPGIFVLLQKVVRRQRSRLQPRAQARSEIPFRPAGAAWCDTQRGTTTPRLRISARR